MTLTEEQRGTVGFDLEKAREAVHTLENFAFASGKITAGQIQDVLWGARLLATSAAEIELLRAELDNYGDDFVCQTKCKDARIKELKADLEQSEICIQARMDVIEAQAIQIKELENALVGLKAEIKIRRDCAGVQA